MSNEIGYWSGIASTGITSEPTPEFGFEHYQSSEKYTASALQKINKIRFRAQGGSSTGGNAVIGLVNSFNVVTNSVVVFVPYVGGADQVIELDVDWDLAAGVESRLVAGEALGFSNQVIFGKDTLTQGAQRVTDYLVGETYTIEGYKPSFVIQLAGDVVAGVPAPSITSVNSGNSVTPGQTVPVVGTAFEATQDAGGATLGSAALTIDAWADALISSTVVLGDNKYGNQDLIITNGSGATSNAFSVSLVPVAAKSFVDIAGSLVDKALRIDAKEAFNLAVTDQVEYDNKDGAVTVGVDGKLSIADGATFPVVITWRVNDSTWGAENTYTITERPTVTISNTSLGAETAVCDLQSSLDGNIFWRVYAAASTPSDTDIKVGTGALQLGTVPVASFASVNANVSGLTGSTQYTFYAYSNDGVIDSEIQSTTFITAGANTAPVVTAPADGSIQFANGAGGLALDDSALLAIFNTAAVTDDNDTLTVSVDLSPFAGSIPAGTHTISFSATDSGGLTDSDTMVLTVSEAAVTLTKKVKITGITNVVGVAVTQLFDHWYLTDLPVNIINKDGVAINSINAGENFQLTSGSGEVNVPAATLAAAGKFIAWTNDDVHNIYEDVTVIEE